VPDASPASLDKSGPTTSAVPRQAQSLRIRWAVLRTAVVGWFTAAWSAIDSSLAWIVTPAVAPTAEADLVPEPEPIVEPAVEFQP
jgi:hypothetical protein